MVAAVAFWNFVPFVWVGGLLSSSPGTSGPSRLWLKIGPKDLVLLRLCSANQGPSGPQWGEMMEHELSGNWSWVYSICKAASKALFSLLSPAVASNLLHPT